MTNIDTVNREARTLRDSIGKKPEIDVLLSYALETAAKADRLEAARISRKNKTRAILSTKARNQRRGRKGKFESGYWAGDWS